MIGAAFGGPLDLANLELGKELYLVKCSLDVYKIIGLNGAKIRDGRSFFGHVQGLGLRNVALGLAKVYEHEKGGYELCSVSGIYRLAKEVAIRDREAAATFSREYGVEPSADWVHDLDEVFAKQRPILGQHLSAVYQARDTRIAHLQQPDSPSPLVFLPSVRAFEELIAFGVAFHTFVNYGFFQIDSWAIPQDRSVVTALSTVLERLGVADVARDYPPEQVKPT
jgi:hypothetical protein